MDEAEALIATRASRAGITVGVFESYGPAQRLDVRKATCRTGVACAKASDPSRKAKSLRSITILSCGLQRISRQETQEVVSGENGQCGGIRRFDVFCRLQSLSERRGGDSNPRNRFPSLTV